MGDQATGASAGQPAAAPAPGVGNNQPAAAATTGSAAQAGTPAPGTAQTPPAAQSPEAQSPAAKLVAAQRSEREARDALKTAQGKAEQFDRLADLIKRDPDAALKLLNSSYASLTEHYSGADDQPWKDELDAVKSKLADRERAEAEANAEASFKAQSEHVAAAAKSGGDKFKLCARKGDAAYRTAVAAVAHAWEADGKPDLDQAAYDGYVSRALEALEAHFAAELKLLSDPPPATDAGAGAAAPAAAPAASGPAATITSSVAGSAGTSPAVRRPMTPREAAAAWAAEFPN